MRSSLLSASLRSSLLIDSGGNLQKLDELRVFFGFFFFFRKNFRQSSRPCKVSRLDSPQPSVRLRSQNVCFYTIFCICCFVVFAQLTLSNINAQLFLHCDNIFNGFILVSAEQRGVSERLLLHPKPTGACGDGRGTACLCNCDDRSCDLR